MRLIHTSDWHLGQHFMGKSRHGEHAALIDWLLQQVRAHAVDAVIIAGDIFDTGTPPSYARELYHRLVLALADANCQLLLLGGNHDSSAVLGESRELLARLGTQVIATASSDDREVQVLLARDGTPGCVVCAVPFLRPRDILTSQAGQSAADKQQSLLTAIQHHYATVYAAAEAKRTTLAATLGRRVPLIATGHLTTVGASSSESVREIYVGSLDALPTDALPPADYIALGHIHRPQIVGGQEHIRYSGSPLPLSFDEAEQDKQVLLVDLGPDGLEKITALPVPRFQALAAVRCTLADLPAAVATAVGRADANGRLSQPEISPLWLEITIVADDYLADLPARIQAACAPWPVEVLRIRRARGQQAASMATASVETLDELGPTEVFARRLALEALPPEQEAALNTRYRQLLAELTPQEVVTNTVPAPVSTVK